MKVILSLRPKEVDNELSRLFGELNLPYVNIPIVRVIPMIRVDKINYMFKFKNPEFTIFTSQISVKILETALKRINLLREFLSFVKKSKIIAIGPKTKEALERWGIEVKAVPKIYCSYGLWRMLASKELKNLKVILFRSFNSDRKLEEKLVRRGAFVFPVYTHRLELSEEIENATRLLIQGEVGILILTSPLLADYIDKGLKKHSSSLKEIAEKVKIVSIGPVTSRRLKQIGIDRFIESNESSSSGLFKTVRALCSVDGNEM